MKPPMANAHEKSEFFGFSILKILFFLLPRSICLAIGGALGSLFYHIDKKRRQISLSNLDIAFGSVYPAAEKKKIARACFMHFGRVFADLIKIQQVKKDKLLRSLSIEGSEHLENALAIGKGVLA